MLKVIAISLQPGNVNRRLPVLGANYILPDGWQEQLQKNTMKSKLILVIGLVFGLSLSFPGFPAGEEDSLQEGPGVFQFDRFLIDHVPGGYFYPFFIENYAPDATFLIEENNGFSLPDNPRVYFEGDSFINFNWLYNGININSALNDGSPAIILPFSAVSSYRLQGESPLYREYGMNFLSPMPGENFSRLTASSVYTDLGGYWLPFMIQPVHPGQRDDRLYGERRKINNQYFLDYRWSKTFNPSDSHLVLGLSYFNIQRQFNDFNAFDTTFNENGKLFLADTRFKKNLENGFYELFGVFNYLDRSHQGAETGSYPQETSQKQRFAFITGLVLNKKTYRLALSVLVENEELTPTVKNFSKDLMDNDGNGLYPYGQTSENKTGTFSSAAVNLNLGVPLEFRLFNRPVKLNTFGDLRYSVLNGNETSHDYNAVLFDNTPYQVVVWNKGNHYRNTNVNARLGMMISADISNRVSLLAKCFLNYDGLGFSNSGNNLNFFHPAFDIGMRLSLFKNKKTGLLFSYGIIPYDIREHVNFFLETARPSGTIYRWNDSSGDREFQPGEEGGIFGYTGGSYHLVAENISAPLKERLLLHFSTPLSTYFVLNIKGIYKRIKNNFRIIFNREYGFYEPGMDGQNGQQIYFFNSPFRDYYLSNGGYEKTPFYAQFLIDIRGRRADKWFFAFSFLAHMGMGNTAFGSGPGSNDTGILAENQADPNSWINGFGRVDGDRGFVAKGCIGVYIVKKLFAAISLKYRDGNPFAFFNTLSKYGQRVIYYQTIKAENEKGLKGGPREDYVADVSIKLSYHFKLFNRDAVMALSLFNILDFGAELSEYVYSGGSRDAVELQIPRSIRLTFGWRF
jgi:hypothetical protein